MKRAINHREPSMEANAQRDTLGVFVRDLAGFVALILLFVPPLAYRAVRGILKLDTAPGKSHEA